jgi:hypothetical protein
MVQEELSLYDLLHKAKNREGYIRRIALIQLCWNSVTFPCIENNRLLYRTSHIIFLQVSSSSVHIRNKYELR